MLVQKLRQSIQSTNLLTSSDRILVAYSGGADSTCLLVILRELYRDVAAGYVNHQLRGEESEAEERFVRAFCSERGIPLHIAQLAWAESGARSEEETRKKRYAELRKMAAEGGYTKIAVAHHREDRVETLLLRLLRGSGPSGLIGLKPRRGIFVRPMLNVNRTEIDGYLNDRGISYFTDNSNLRSDFRRNRVRNELLPYLRQHFNPRTDDAIARTAEWIEEQNELVEELLKKFTASIKDKHTEVIISRRIWDGLSLPLRKAVLRKAVSLFDPNLHPSAKSLSRLLQAIAKNREMELPGHTMIKSHARSIRITRKAGQTGFFETEIPHEGSYLFRPANLVLSFSVVQHREPFTMENIAFLDFEKASFPLYIRNWKKGDAFTPLGMQGTKKISDFLIDRKVPRPQRKKIPLVFKDQDLIWIAGHQISNKYRVTDQTKKMLKIEMKERNA